MTVFWPALAGGIFCVAVGTGLIIYQGRLAAMNANAQRAALGKAGDRVAKRSTPGRMLSTGIGIIVIGVVGIVLSLLNLNW